MKTEPQPSAITPGGSVKDITLSQINLNCAEIIQELPAAIYTCDIEGKITFFNDAAVTLWGRIPRIGEDLWCGSWKIYQTDGTLLPMDAHPMAITLKTGKAVKGVEIVIERP